MKSSSELTDYYYNILHGDLLDLEEERKKIKSKISIRISFLILLFVGIMYGIYSINNSFHNSHFFIAVLGVAISTFIYKLSIKDYATNFKFRIIAPLIKAIDEKLDYRAASHVSINTFRRSKLFKREAERFGGNDLVKGSIEGISLQFSDIHAQYKATKSKESNDWRTLFQGLFIVADFNKHFHATTLVLPDRAEKTLGALIGGWVQSNNTQHGQLMKMDNIEFEKHFVVYGGDPIEARYILTPSMMQRIVDFKHRSKQDLYISFTSDKIHIAIAYNKDLFEPTVFSSLLDYKSAMEYIKTLHLAVGIVQELQLNQKLWSKQ
ncbi:MAG: DUF3137 domain-containing protein [Campylobacterota bacterium]|nr:DUF3137 domain-containing protein [Campylobacterota bacterium]